MLEDGLNRVESELVAERGAALFRITKKMQAALDALRQFDETTGENTAPAAERERTRVDLLVQAAESVWFFVVQRESLRLPNNKQVYKEYGIPEELIAVMGPREAIARALQKNNRV